MRPKARQGRQHRLMTTAQLLQLLAQLLPRLKAKYGVRQMALFGSFAKGGAKATSDIDILVDLSQPLGFAFVSLAAELEKALGRPVDLTTFETLARHEAGSQRQHLAREIRQSLIYV